MTRIYAITALALVLAMLLGLGAAVFLNQGGATAQACSGTTIAEGAAIGGPFELVSETGDTVTDAEVIDRPALIYFGYTFCPDVCSIDVSRNAVAADILAERGIAVRPIFITIDPERDTPEVLADFTENIHPDMVGLTGSAEQIKDASKTYKTYYKKVPGDPEFYLVDHTTLTYLVMPESGFVEFFRRDATAEQLADITECFVGTTA